MEYSNWDDFLQDEFKKEYFKNLSKKIKEDERVGKVYPIKEDRLNAFRFTKLDDVKVVILGQDPYINEGEAMGLSFSVPDGKRIPPSLKNIFKEIQDTTGCGEKTTGNLTYLTKQGVFLLNCALTVKAKNSNSHQKYGYEMFSDNVMSLLNEIDRPVVFMLWGNFAKKKGMLLNNPKHLVLEAVHPSPLARGGFLGCNHFNLANEFLEENGLEKINW